MTTKARGGRPHVVVVGGGFAGMNAAHALAHSDAEITLVDRHNYHTFQPLLYQVSTSYLPPEEVSAAFRSVFRRQANLKVRVADRRLRLEDGSTLDFDYLILAAGAETNFFAIEGMAEHAWPLYTLADAVALRTHLLGALEQVAGTGPPANALNTTVVVGGGPSGVETAGALASMAQGVVGPVATHLPTEVQLCRHVTRDEHLPARRRLLPELDRRQPDGSRAGSELHRSVDRSMSHAASIR